MRTSRIPTLIAHVHDVLDLLSLSLEIPLSFYNRSFLEKDKICNTYQMLSKIVENLIYTKYIIYVTQL